MNKLMEASEPVDPYEQNLQDFEWALSLNRLTLRFMGVWPGDEDVPGIAGLAVLLRVPIMVVFMICFIFLPQMYALTLVYKDLPLVIDNLTSSPATLLLCIKLLFIWHSKKVLRPVIQSVTQDWLRLNKHDWEIQAMKRESTRARIFTISGYVFLLGAYSTFALSPFFDLGIHPVSNLTDYGDRHLIVQSYFPYDYSKSPNYEITLVLQQVAGVFIILAISVPDNYFTALVFHVTAQFEILDTHIKNFIREDEKDRKGPNFSRKLGYFVERHVHLIAMISAIESSFTYVVMSQLFCMSVVVCCLGFHILGMFNNTGTAEKPPTLQILTVFTTLFALMMHTLVDCFASENLAMRSSGIFHSVYDTNWYLLPNENIRDVIMMMFVSMRPMQLTAGKIFYLSLPTYCNILKSVAGYISVLIAVNRS